jgi:hypothetical protein
MSATILTPKSVYTSPTASLRPQQVQIGPLGGLHEKPRETPNLNFK